MSPKFLFICTAASLALTACAAPVQSQPSAASQPPGPTTPPSAAATPTSRLPTPASTAQPSPGLVQVTPGAFENSLLVTEWTDESREDRLYPLDPASGQPLPGYPPIALGTQYVDALSPGRRTLAIVKPGSLFLLDLSTWQEQAFELPLVANVSAMAFDPRGRQLAVVYGDRESQILVFDLEQQAVTAQGSLDFHASRLKFTLGNGGLMLYGTLNETPYAESAMSSGPPRVALLEAGDLSLGWSAELEGVRDGVYSRDGGTLDLSQPDSGMYLYPGLAFAPDRDALYVIHPDQDELTIVDFAAQKVDTLEVRTPLTLLERLLTMTAGVARAKIAQGTTQRAVISPDGQFLYVVGRQNTVQQDDQGNWQINANPLGLQAIRTFDGARLAHVDTQADDLTISPDGRFLYLSSWAEGNPWTDVFDTSNQDVIARLDGTLRPVFRMNGELLLASSDWNGTSYHTTVVDPNSLAVLADWTGPGYIAWLSAP
jgi:DNA-binding beta-propeller fold protein YncE